jgi:hypothetical protein
MVSGGSLANVMALYSLHTKGNIDGRQRGGILSSLV